MGLIDSLLGHAGETPVDKLEPELRPLLAAGEPLEAAFTFVRDMIVFTDRRLILINKQGVTAKKVEYRSIPYRSIVMHSLETAGHFDLESDFKLWLSGQPAPIELKLGRGEGSTRLVSLLSQHMPR
ncbi:MAG: PH domain-containing protein [Xanthomonadaceae bacterium]|nr:PH domain-containing protein [Xanthomonadaceae bacterium]